MGNQRPVIIASREKHTERSSEEVESLMQSALLAIRMGYPEAAEVICQKVIELL